MWHKSKFGCHMGPFLPNITFFYLFISWIHPSFFISITTAIDISQVRKLSHRSLVKLPKVAFPGFQSRQAVFRVRTSKPYPPSSPWTVSWGQMWFSSYPRRAHFMKSKIWPVVRRIIWLVLPWYQDPKIGDYDYFFFSLCP